MFLACESSGVLMLKRDVCERPNFRLGSAASIFTCEANLLPDSSTMLNIAWISAENILLGEKNKNNAEVQQSNESRWH